MKALIAAAVLLSVPALAQVEIEVEAPKLRFAVAPTVVVIAPGVQVVPDHDEEVFLVGGSYWLRRGPHWFRAQGHRGEWIRVKAAGVPRQLIHLPPGKYRHYKPGRHGGGEGHRVKHHSKHGKGDKKGRSKGGKGRD